MLFNLFLTDTSSGKLNEETGKLPQLVWGSQHLHRLPYGIELYHGLFWVSALWRRNHGNYNPERIFFWVCIVFFIQQIIYH